MDFSIEKCDSLPFVYLLAVPRPSQIQNDLVRSASVPGYEAVVGRALEVRDFYHMWAVVYPLVMADIAINHYSLDWLGKSLTGNHGLLTIKYRAFL